MGPVANCGPAPIVSEARRVSVKNILAAIGLVALLVIFRSQIVQLIDVINSMANTVPQ